MSSISQNNSNEVALLDCVQKFFIKHHVGRLLKQCNGTKEKGVSAVSLLKYKMGNIFTGRSMYMQQKTGSFKEAFSKNTFYRFLNSTKTNWLRFTSLLAADIVKNDLKHLTDDSRKNVFIIDDSLFHRTSCKKTELGSKVFDHTGMKAWKDYKNIDIKGMAITILVCNNFSVTEKRDDLSLLDTVTNIIDSLEDSFHCYKPVTPTDEDLFADVSETSKNEILKGLNNLKKKLDAAINEKSNEKDATDILQKVFGERFPTGEDADKDIAESTAGPIKLGNEDKHFA